VISSHQTLLLVDNCPATVLLCRRSRGVGIGYPRKRHVRGKIAIIGATVLLVLAVPLLALAWAYSRATLGYRCCRDKAMARQPTLETSRLQLRPFRMADADDVQRLAAIGPWPILRSTFRTPRRRPGGEMDLQPPRLVRARRASRLCHYASVRRTLIGAVGCRTTAKTGAPNLAIGSASLTGPRLLHRGGSGVDRVGFEQLGLNRIHACHLPATPLRA